MVCSLSHLCFSLVFLNASISIQNLQGRTVKVQMSLFSLMHLGLGFILVVVIVFIALDTVFKVLQTLLERWSPFGPSIHLLWGELRLAPACRRGDRGLLAETDPVYFRLFFAFALPSLFIISILILRSNPQICFCIAENLLK